MKRSLIFLILLFKAWILPAQSKVQSIFMEFGYVNLPKDPLIETMYGSTKYRFYMDEKFILFQTMTNPKPLMGQSFGPGLNMSYIMDRNSKVLFLCAILDTIKLRMSGDEGDIQYIEETLQSNRKVGLTILGKQDQEVTILNKLATRYLAAGTFSDSAYLFIHEHLRFAKHLRQFPMCISTGKGATGLLLGRDDILHNGTTLEFRALELELNQPRDIPSIMNEYQLVTKEEGELAIKKFMNPELEDSKNGKN